MSSRKFLKLVSFSGIGGGAVAAYNWEETKSLAIGSQRFGRAALTVFSVVLDYKQTLYSGGVSAASPNYNEIKSQTHQRSAQKLLDLCCANGGAFIKVGQHLGSLEYLLPSEYVNTMKVLHADAPKSPLNELYQVIEEELNLKVEDVFTEFSENPLGTASLAQVHRARLKDGREVAVKVQHPAVKSHSVVDMKGMEFLMTMVSTLFPDFDFMWLVKEMKINLPLELDFSHEAENAEKVAKLFEKYPWLKVPSIHWDLTTNRLLIMEYCDGGQVNDRNYMMKNKINMEEVSEKISTLYSEMIFVNGFVHCDPHPGNLLVKNSEKGADIILLDHGLYIDLPIGFRARYSQFWQSIINSDLEGIRKHGEDLGVGQLYGLFACMVTARSWNSISKGIAKKERSSNEENEIKSDAAKYLPEIAAVLNRVPREMLLILKTNDLLRGIEYSLNIQDSMKSFITMSRCCVRAVFNERRQFANSSLLRYYLNISESWAQFRITLYQVYLWYLRSNLGNYFNKSLMEEDKMTAPGL